MRTVLFFDQIQAGRGGKDKPEVELQVDKGGIGSYTMFERYCKKQGLNVVATISCGTDYFKENKEEVEAKINKLLTKIKAEMILCGPTYDYPEFASMAAAVGSSVVKNTDCKAVVMCAEEKNLDTINEYKDEVLMIQMPKKGGIGLNDSLDAMTKVAKLIHEDKSLEEFSERIFK